MYLGHNMKIMTEIFIATLIFFSSFNLSISAEYRINQDEKGFKLDIYNIQANIINSPDNIQLMKADIDDFHAIVPDNSEYDIVVLKYQFAAPGVTAENIHEQMRVSLEAGDEISLGKVEIFKRNIRKDAVATILTNQEYVLEYAGIQRGIAVANLYINPFRYNPETKELRLIENLDLQVSFKNALTLLNNNLDRHDNALFANIINKRHLNTLLANVKASKKESADRKLGSKNWYDSETTYARISTTEDGITKLSAEDIIEAEPAFNGKSLSGFHLLYRGDEYPLYTYSDTDGILNAGDEFLFIGHRPEGDTTWLDHYSGEAVFYLYHTYSAKGLRYTSFPNVNASEELDEVTVEKHFEKELDYTLGYYINYFEALTNEGWYWKSVSSIAPDNVFSDTSIFIVPIDNSFHLMNLQVEFMSYNWNLKKNIQKQRVSIALNNNELHYEAYPVHERHTYDVNIGRINFVGGYNNLQFFNLGNTDTEGNLITPDEVGFNYYYFKMNVKPFANNGRLNCLVNYKGSDLNLNAYGFDDDEIVIIDTLSNYIKEDNQAIAGAKVIAGAVYGDNPYVSMVINENKYIDSENKGLHLVVLENSGSQFSHYFYAEYSSQLETVIDNMSAGSVILAVFNGSSGIDKYSATFEKLGAKKIKSLEDGKLWAFSALKNDKSSAIESESLNESVTLSNFYDIPNGQSFRLQLGIEAGKRYSFFMEKKSAIRNALVTNVNKSTLRNAANKGSSIIITHPDFIEAANELAEYRSITHPELDVKVVDVDAIYLEFNHGRKSPHAIKDFLKYAYNNWEEAPRYVTLMGDACWDGLKRMQNTIYNDYIPSYGRPVADYWYAMLDGEDFIPEIILARIPCANIQEAITYIEKVKAYEAAPDNPWMKNFLFLSGGYDEDQRATFYSRSRGFAEEAYNSNLCVDTFLIRKRDKAVAGETEANSIISRINEGVCFITFLGHGAPTVFDMDGWGVEKLTNKDKYSFFSSISCGTGNFGANDAVSRNEDYIFEPNAGFTAASGTTSTGLADAGTELMTRFFRSMKDQTINSRNYGALLNLSKTAMGSVNGNAFNMMMEFSLTADPLIEFRIAKNPDLYFIDREIEIQSAGEVVFVDEDSVHIAGILRNMGIRVDDQVGIRLIREYEGVSDTIDIAVEGSCRGEEFAFALKTLDMPGVHNLTIIADYEENVDDPDRENNIWQAKLEVFQRGFIALDPLPYWDVSSSNPLFRVVNPLDNEEGVELNYEFALKKSNAPDSPDLIKSGVDDISKEEAYLEWKPDIDLDDNEIYWLFARYMISGTDEKSAWLVIPFTANAGYKENRAEWLQERSLLASEGKVEGMTIKDGKIQLEETEIPYSIFGATGYRDEINNLFVDVGVEVKFGETYYVSSIGNNRGCNVVVMSKDLEHVASRTWDTWGPTFYQDAIKDSLTINLVKFLRDSVEEGQYVAFATKDQAFREFIIHNDINSSGSLDTLQYVLKETYGSQMADSIIYGSAFVMLAQKGNLLNESFDVIRNFQGKEGDNRSDTARITGNITKYTLEGRFESTEIGPGKQWNELTLNGDFSGEGVHINTRVYGLKPDGGEPVELINQEGYNIDLSSIDAHEYPRLKSVFDLKRDTENVAPYISGMECDFIPAAEFAFLNSTAKIIGDSLLRGYPISFSASVQNISPRVKSDASTVRMKIFNDNSNELDGYLVPISGLDPDEKETFGFDTETDYYETSNNLVVEINADRDDNEHYYFNNTYLAHIEVKEDTIHPTVIVKHDGFLMKEGDYITFRPYIEIELYDNSPMLVKDEDKLTARMNSKVIENGEFESFEKSDAPLKATLKFFTDSITERHNRLKVYFSDFAGNRDTVSYNLYTSKSGFVEGLYNYPNPTFGETKFAFKYKAPDHGANAKLTIFDLSGHKIRTVEKIINLGDNTIEWDGYDRYGNSVSSGVYVYLMSITGGVWVEAVTGKMMVVR